jgi:ankyrin repeat protein
MWAAYQGDALSVDLLLRHGANPNLKDDAGLTSLHWAVVRGNRVAIRKLIEKGADLTAKDGEDRTPRDMAAELKSLGAWKRALEEGGMDEYGVKRGKPLSDVRLSFITVLPLLNINAPAKHKNRDFHNAHNLFLSHVHDLDDLAMVYRHLSCISRVFWDAPCTSFFHPISFDIIDFLCSLDRL